jgi:hypothetical protein
MTDPDIQEKLKEIQDVTRKRIKMGRDARIARWQGTLESLLVQLSKRLVPGEVRAVESLNPDEVARFQKLQIILDLPPFVQAAFLPVRVAGQVTPPNAPQLVSGGVEKSRSNKVLVARRDKLARILIAEISPQGPGIDILEDANLLASYNYNTAEECVTDISKIIWIHFRNPKGWQEAQYIQYTEGWFYRSALNRTLDLPITENYSYIHHPILLGLDRVDAVFRLMEATLDRLCQDPEETIAAANAAHPRRKEAAEITRQALARGDVAARQALRSFMEDRLLELLKLLRGHEIINFRGFTKPEQRRFKTAFTRVVRAVSDRILADLSNDA